MDGTRDMPLHYGLTAEQQLLRDSVRRLLDARSPVSALRARRDQAGPGGFSGALWAEAVELGWSGILIPEALGGVQLGFTAAALIAEECGRTLAALPFLSSAVLAVTALLQCGSQPQQRALLPRIATGECLLALAVDERARHAPQKIDTFAVPEHGGYRLRGEKIFVLDGSVAHHLIVSARVGSAEQGAEAPIGLFLLDVTDARIEIDATSTMDSRSAADIRFLDVRLGQESLLGGGTGQGAAALERTLDAARALLAAELVGMGRECLRRTVEYLGERRQFGRRIGEFQALQHRLAHLYCELELATSLVRAASAALETPAADPRVLVSAAKAKCAEAALLAASEAVQMHGGIGMTDELDIGLFVKRIRCASETFGDIAFHRDRLATLHGF